ncbi:MAG: GNAT family N-acetyltransferase [Gemmatimonadota bacterium]
MEAEVRVVEVLDEREPTAQSALGLIVDTFPARECQPLAELRSELAEKRLGLLAAYDFHLLAALGRDDDAPDADDVVPGGDRVVASAIAVYLEGVNAGFINYLAVRPSLRGQGLGRALRRRLVEQLRADARDAEFDDLAWVIGEVRPDNEWLRRLVREKSAIPFDLTYYHPAPVPGAADERFVLYRQPVGDAREELPSDLVQQLLYAVYRRAYRVSYPLERPAFREMLAELAARDRVGAHPDYGQ